ncbi:E3 ubiquitin-protein ligase TRIM71-like [Amphiura filiformis]|uniref:E3 ubiquitin-protein ligase TRIM71-like n=1 Tax=Amphiura filiformis TaxID=82378 RepID=UPI003B21F588
MATAQPQPELVPTQSKDLTRCGICNEIINQPKSLPCLHTFCLECLREWSKPNKETVTCPVLNCKKTSLMPSNGVDDLPENVFILSLITTSPYRGRNVPCVCCEETNNDVLARCMDCEGVLCKRGVNAHGEMSFLKLHQVIMLEDLKSGKINLKQVSNKKQPTCKEHNSQQLWLYCETCGVLICRDCTVIDHPKPDHAYVTLKSTVSEQRKKIEALVKRNGVIEKQVDKALQDVTKAQQDLDSIKKKFTADIDMEIEKIEKHVRKICQQERGRLLKQQDEIAALSHKKIQSSKENLQSQKVRFQAGREVANQVLQSGSDSDIASVYKQLTTSLKDLCQEELESVPQDIAVLPVPKFMADSAITSVTTIGKVSDGKHLPSKVSAGSWELESEFVDIEELTNAGSIVTTPTGDIVVADCSFTVPVKVYSSDGKFKFNLDQRSVYTTTVAVSPDGKLYVASGNANFKRIRVFGSNGRYLSQFPVVSPTGVASVAEKTELRGMTVNNKSQLLVGEIRKKYISIHDLNGTHITSFQVRIKPYHIATTSQGNIIVSHDGYPGVHVLDSGGSLHHTITAPTGVSWSPMGVCCSMTDEICICNRGTPTGIYFFSSIGIYLGCVTQDVSFPSGITLMQNDRKMAVIDYDVHCHDGPDCHVKIFCRR